MTRHIVFVLLCLLSLVGEAREYTPAEVPNVQLQDATQLVSDPEGYFTAEERSQLNEALCLLRERHTVETVLIVLPGIENDDPEAFTLKLFELWGIGKAIDDNGLLILYKYGKAGERIIRFEVGYGLEGALPDIATKKLTTDYIVPAIAEGRDAEGFLEAFDKIDLYLTEGYEAQGENEQYGLGGVDGEGYEVITDEQAEAIVRFHFLFSLILGAVYALWLFVKWLKVREPGKQKVFLTTKFKRQWWLYLFLPALFILFPLYWLLKFYSNRHIKDCPQCGYKGTVRTIQGEERKGYLSAIQKVEDRLGSVNYTIHRCSACSYVGVAGLPEFFSKYRKCPSCKAKTYYEKSRSTTSKYTYINYYCANCGKEKVSRTLTSSSSSGGSGGRSRGRSGGGFGGGRSGGGGSTTRF